MIARASEFQASDPTLARLPRLCRVMQSLPTKRRRTIIAMSQLPWFGEGLRRGGTQESLDRHRQLVVGPERRSDQLKRTPILAELRRLSDRLNRLVSQGPRPASAEIEGPVKHGPFSP